MPIIDDLERCYKNHCTEPTLRELKPFARANDIPMPPQATRTPYSDCDHNERTPGSSASRGSRRSVARGERLTRANVGTATTANAREAEWSEHDEIADRVAWYLRQAGD